MTGDVLVVIIDGEPRAIAVAQVREVLPLANITPVPTAPPSVRGVSQVRGQVLPVLSLSREVRDPRPGDPLVVVDHDGVRAALLVERVVGVNPPGQDSTPLDVATLHPGFQP